MNLKEYLTKEKPNLSASSITTYNSILTNLYKKVFGDMTIELEKLISSSISSDVSIEESFIKISYKDFCDLDRIINLLLKEKI